MRTRWLIAMGATMVGAVWVLQGLGMLPGTGFMDGDLFWAAAGGVFVAIGVAVGVSAWRGRRST